MRTRVFALACFLALSLATAAESEPISKNLDSFAVLVPDYSATCGGVLPAVSKDGSVVAFQAYSSKNPMGELYCLDNINQTKERVATKPRAITFKANETSTGISAYASSPRMDWSPDGKRLAVAHYDGCLYILDNTKQGDKSQISARVIAKPTLYKDEKQTGHYYCPKWSPDGKKIAVLSIRKDLPSVLQVIDVESGKSIILADDAMAGDEAWSQPWSPDSTRLIYASVIHEQFSDGSGDHKSIPRGLRIISVDGKSKTRIEGDENCYSPSWSSSPDKVLFVRRPVEEIDMGSVTPYAPVSKLVIRDLSRQNEVCLYGVNGGVTDEQKKAISAMYYAKIGARFKEQFGAMLTKEIAAKIDAGELDDSCLMHMGWFYAAKQTGGEVWKLYSRYESDLGMKDFLGSTVKVGSAETSLSNTLSDKANRILTKEQFDAFASKAMTWYAEAGLCIREVLPDTCERAVWSPDETRVAWVRRSRTDDSQCLLVIDAKTGAQTEVCSAAEIACISWANNKTLIAQTCRAMSRYTDDTNIHSTASYPEIWMMTLK